MSINVDQPNPCADFGDAWLRNQTVRILQRHLQFGLHRRLDMDALLCRVTQAAISSRVFPDSSASLSQRGRGPMPVHVCPAWSL